MSGPMTMSCYPPSCLELRTDGGRGRYERPEHLQQRGGTWLFSNCSLAKEETI